MWVSLIVIASWLTTLTCVVGLVYGIRQQDDNCIFGSVGIGLLVALFGCGAIGTTCFVRTEVRTVTNFNVARSPDVIVITVNGGDVRTEYTDGATVNAKFDKVYVHTQYNFYGGWIYDWVSVRPNQEKQ